MLCEAFLAHVEGDRELALNTLRQALALAKEGARKYYLRFFECCVPPEPATAAVRRPCRAL